MANGNLIVTDLSEKAVQMTNARFARMPLSGMFSSWTKIRVALHINLVDSGANLTGVEFGFGLCSGTSAILGDASTTNFVGAVGAAAATWTRITSPSTGYTVASMFPATRVGSTTTRGTGFGLGGSGFVPMCLSRKALFIDVTRTSATAASLRIFAPNTASSTDITAASFVSLSNTETPSATSHNFPNAVAITWAESNGALDAACVAWNIVPAPFNIHGLRVIRFT